jgi:hypothetical protein
MNNSTPIRQETHHTVVRLVLDDLPPHNGDHANSVFSPARCKEDRRKQRSIVRRSLRVRLQKYCSVSGVETHVSHEYGHTFAVVVDCVEVDCM